MTVQVWQALDVFLPIIPFSAPPRPPPDAKASLVQALVARGEDAEAPRAILLLPEVLLWASGALRVAPLASPLVAPLAALLATIQLQWQVVVVQSTQHAGQAQGAGALPVDQGAASSSHQDWSAPEVQFQAWVSS